MRINRLFDQHQPSIWLAPKKNWSVLRKNNQIILFFSHLIVFLYRLHAESGVKTAGTAIRKEFLWRCGIPYILKAYITRFVLDSLKPEKFQIRHGTTATIDVHRVCLYTTYRRGVVVARFDGLGNLRASESGASNGRVSTLFCILGNRINQSLVDTIWRRSVKEKTMSNQILLL